VIDELDQAVLLRSVFPSYGPAWEAAIDYGIDVSLLTDFLSLTPEQRARRLTGSLRWTRASGPGGEESVTIDVEALLRRLVAAGVEFVVVGGVAARAHGSAMLTQDLDVVAPLTVENIRRLLTAVGDLNPRYALTLDKRRVTESAEYLAAFKNLYLLTDLGRLDVLGSVEPIGTYEVVAQHAEETTLLGPTVRVIGIEDLITVKAHVGRPKDRHAELELRAIRELRAKR
jgi:predicted nucleotidyltransferase